MSEEKDVTFGEGIFFKKKDNAPDFVIGAVSVKVDEFIGFLKENVKKGWVNMDVKLSKSGKYYFQVDTWEPKPQGDNANAPAAPAKAAAAPVAPQPDKDLPF